MKGDTDQELGTRLVAKALPSFLVCWGDGGEMSLLPSGWVSLGGYKGETLQGGACPKELWPGDVLAEVRR